MCKCVELVFNMSMLCIDILGKHRTVFIITAAVCRYSIQLRLSPKSRVRLVHKLFVCEMHIFRIDLKSQKLYFTLLNYHYHIYLFFSVFSPSLKMPSPLLCHRVSSSAWTWSSRSLNRRVWRSTWSTRLNMRLNHLHQDLLSPLLRSRSKSTITHNAVHISFTKRHRTVSQNTF